MQSAKKCEQWMVPFSEWLWVKLSLFNRIPSDWKFGRVKDFHADFTTGLGSSCEFSIFLLTTSIVFLCKHDDMVPFHRLSSHKFGTTWRWVNDDLVFILCDLPFYHSLVNICTAKAYFDVYVSFLVANTMLCDTSSSETEIKKPVLNVRNTFFFLPKAM